MKYALIASLLSAATTLVSAHGYVEKAVIDGVSYNPYLPYYDPYVSPKRELIWRPIVGNGPVENLSLIDVQCGGYTAGGTVGSKPAPLHAPIAAGGEVSLTWTQWPDSHKGPLITYMAKCPGDCSTWEPGTAAVWFKIKEEGKSASGVWVSEQYETLPVPPYKFNIPSNLAPGNYIVRHEILALHGAWAYPGIQAYPSCFQVTVTGSGTALPSSDYLVSFPGAYTESTPGIVFDMYNPSLPYPIPGPKVWSGQGGSNATTSPKPTTSSAAPTTTSRAVVTTTSRAVVTTSTTVPPAATSTTAAPAPTGATVPKWGQCGGIGYTGPTTCVAGSTCTKSNDYYFQCL